MFLPDRAVGFISHAVIPPCRSLDAATKFVSDMVQANPALLEVPLNFSAVVPAYPNDRQPFPMTEPLRNPQCLHFFEMLGIDVSRLSNGNSGDFSSSSNAVYNPEEIELDGFEFTSPAPSSSSSLPDQGNPEEINLDDD